MSRDNFTAKLCCPRCGREGLAQLSEEDGASYLFGNQRTTLESLPDGFTVVEGKSRIASFDMHCTDCRVSAVT